MVIYRLSKKQKIAFIINPVAGSGVGKKVVRQVKEIYACKEDVKLKVEVTEYKLHASELTDKCKEKNYDTVVAVGGDGTVNEVARRLVGSNLKLGIIPVGSGNGLARHLGIPRDPQKALELIVNGQVKAIDAGLINGQYFFCTCGVGFDARVGTLFADSQERGFKSYIKTSLKEFFNYEAEKYKLKIDGEKFSERAFLITFANASQYGNNVYIAPLAGIADGLIDVSVLKSFPLQQVLGISFRLFTRKIHRSKFMKVYRGREITIKRKKSGEVHIDGEPVKMGRKIKVSILPAKLNVLV